MDKNINKNIDDISIKPSDTSKISKLKIRVSKGCIVCGEPVQLTEMEELLLQHGRHIDSKVCENCKKAILYIRNEMNKVK